MLSPIRLIRTRCPHNIAHAASKLIPVSLPQRVPVPSWAPWTTLCKTDIQSRPLWRRRTRWWSESCIDRRSRQKTFSRARVGHARVRAKRALANSSPRGRGAVPADLDVLWCLARAVEATRLPRRCVDGQASSLQARNLSIYLSYPPNSAKRPP